jgi:putative redox protein
MPIHSSVLATFVDPVAGSRIDALTAAGQPVTFDLAEAGALRAGASPTETLLAALAACTAIDVAAILRKKRQRVDRYQIAVSAERRDDHPRVFTSIVVEHRVAGDVEAEALRRSVELSATRYCPVSAMLAASVRVEHRYLLHGDGVERAGPSALAVVTGPGDSPQG